MCGAGQTTGCMCGGGGGGAGAVQEGKARWRQCGGTAGRNRSGDAGAGVGLEQLGERRFAPRRGGTRRRRRRRLVSWPGGLGVGGLLRARNALRSRTTTAGPSRGWAAQRGRATAASRRAKADSSHVLSDRAPYVPAKQHRRGTCRLFGFSLHSGGELPACAPAARSRLLGLRYRAELQES
jgi:hypothetical protein